MATVKIIKQHIDGARFSDVLLTVLSKSLHRYFNQKIFELDADEIPEEITVVLPIRMEAEGVQLKIQNRFSVALQTLPILPGTDAIQGSEKLEQSKKHIEAIKMHTDILRSSPDYLVSGRFSTISPETLKQLAFRSTTGSCLSCPVCFPTKSSKNW
jgi:hypothetical protein